MSFNSLHFLLFLPVVVILYYVLPHKVRWVMLLIASYYAYMVWNSWLIFPILGTTVVSYVAALLIEKTQKTGFRKLLLILTLVICLGTLIFFKYFNFLIQSVVDFLNLFTLNIDSFALNIILPIGISFYTFQTLSYVIDVYRRTYKAEKHFGYYALYVSFFPQLVAGPIERPDKLIPQLREKHKLNTEDMSSGFRIFLMGFFRKCVVADLCGVYVNNVFADLSNSNAFAILIAGLLFIVQVYNDFAGYSEIATGAARMMGIKLMRNFDRPLLATSLRDFMSRWHISLNTWFKDYVYFPLGGSKKGKVRKFFNIMIVYFFCGLWHGANWTFVFWGLYVGFVICLEHLFRKVYKKFCTKLNIDNSKPGIILIRRIAVLIIFSFGAFLFRSSSIAQFGEVIAKLFTSFGFGADYTAAAFTSLGMTIFDFMQVLLCIVVMALIYNMDKRGHCESMTVLHDSKEEASMSARRTAAYVFLVLSVALAWLMTISGNISSAFVYFQF